MRHYAVTQVTLIVIGHPGVDISRLSSEFPIFAQMIPRENTSEGLLTLSILEVSGIAVVDGQHRQLSIRIDVPRIESQAVALARVVVDLLQQVKIFVSTATIAFNRIVLVDDIHLLVVDVYLLVVVAVFIVVWRRRVYRTSRHLPMVVTVGQAQKFVEGLERAYALNILQSNTIVLGGFGR